MTTYQSRNQIHEQLVRMIPEQISECQKYEELPPALAELICHNFQAKFVCYEKETEMVEVGIEMQENQLSYPEIMIHKFPLKKALSWLGSTFKHDDQDLKFYGKLIAGNGIINRVDEVVLV